MADKFVVNQSMANVDKLFRLRRKLSLLKKQEAALADSVIAKFGKRAVQNGYEYTVSLSEYDMVTLDPVKVAKLIGEKAMKRCMNRTEVRKLVFAKRD